MKQAYNIYHQNVLDRQLGPHGPFAHYVMPAFQATPRSFFVPENRLAEAYTEAPVLLKNGKMVFQPLFYAQFMNYLQPQKERNIMLIGGGTGYGAALFRDQYSTVFMHETDNECLALCQAAFKSLSIDNVVLCQGNVRTDAERQGPFHWIFIEGVVDFVPRIYFDYLDADSPGIFAFVAKEGVFSLCQFSKQDTGEVYATPLFQAMAPSARGFQHKERFVF